MTNIDDEEKEKLIKETKTKIIWQLTNNEDLDCIIYGDGKIHGGVGDSNAILNALSNLVMGLLQSGIPKYAIKKAIKVGLNWERYILEDE